MVYHFEHSRKQFFNFAKRHGLHFQKRVGAECTDKALLQTVAVDDSSRTQAEKIARICATGGLRSRILRTLL
jgi:hypothetical protein